ncbi:MAG: molecular chaperone TorD family protein [Actinomycetota bacterium]|jgi:hypothetical protein|nr:molecular chaperone TorD family protein [Actinomycetota bacterium]MDA8293060.1 molecular chaperone TorD family protein [Actinomycetota bacterium]
MFTYSLQGLELSAAEAGPIEVEENETTARSAVYQFFGGWFATAPADLFDQAAEGKWVAGLTEAASLLPFGFAIGPVEVPAGADAASFAADHERVLGGGALLGGGGRADREAEIAAVRREYEYFGLAASDAAPRPADHLATELDFLQYLCFREAATPSPRLATSFRRAQRDFLDAHVLDWVPGLVASAGRGAGPLVGWTLDQLAAFVSADRAYVAERLGG